jgi:hypothetical protein
MRKRKRTWSKIASAVAAACLLAGIPGNAFADGNVKMEVEIGFDGAYKAGSWTFVQVTLENQGPDFQGEVEIAEKNAAYSPSSDHYGTYAKPVVLPKGTTKTVVVEVPATYLGQPLDVRLVDEKGQTAAVVNPGISTPLKGALLVGKIAAKEADLNFFTQTAGPGVGDKVYVRQLDGTNLPEKAELLNAIDVLVVNHAPKEKLSEEQVNAIKSWVQSGGNLILSGGAQYAGGAGQFADLSPVSVTGMGEVSDLSGLEKLAGQKPNVQSLTVTTGSLKQGANALAKAGDVPLIAWQQAGDGKVFYAAYDLSVEPLASWDGNEELWARVLAERAVSDKVEWGNSDPDNMMFMSQSASTFAGLLPSMKMLMLAFGAYVLVAGPGLYIVLRRKKRQEWAWWLIPVTSVVFAAGIFGVGSLERGTGSIAQSISLVELAGEDVANVKAAASFVVQSGGDYAVEAATDELRIAPIDASHDGNEAKPKAKILQDGAKQFVHFHDVEYFTSREASLSGTLHGLGRVEHDLSIDADGNLKGTVVNKSNLELKNAHLLAGTAVYSLGDLAPGESVQVEKRYQYTAPSSASPMYENLKSQLIGFPVQQYGWAFDIERERKRTLVNAGIPTWGIGDAQLMLFALSETPLNLYLVDGEKPKRSEDHSLVMQKLALKQEGSAVKWPTGLVRPKLVATEGNVHFSYYELMMDGGAITLEYDLKTIDGFVPEKATIDLDNSTYSVFEKKYYNWQTKQWEKAEGAILKELSKADLQKFMSPDGKLLLKVEGSTHKMSVMHLHFPSMGVEGKVSS